jgi:hypothetical protein
MIWLLVITSINLKADPPFKRHLIPMPGENFPFCDTSRFYDANTAVTFLGDSRMDLVDNIAYGAASLDHYFATHGTWNEILEFFSPWY